MATIASPASLVPLTTKFEEFSIKKLDPDRMERDYRFEKKLEKEAPPTSLSDLITFIIQTYKEQQKKEFQDDEINFDPIKIPEGTWKDNEHHEFSLRVYVCSIKIVNKIATILENLGANIPPSRENSFLIFLYRTREKAREIFALTRGYRGYFPVQPYTDYNFPRKIAYRLLDPKDRSKESSKMLLGPVLSDKKILRSSEDFDPTDLHKIYTGFQTCIRKNASLLAFPPFHKKDGSIPEKTAQVEIKQGALRLLKTLSLSHYPPILDLFSQIDRGENTFCYLYPASEEPNLEMDHKEDFAFFENFIPSSPSDVSALNRKVKEMLAEQMISEKLFDWEFCHPHVEDYFRAHDFKLRYKGIKKAPLEWEDDRISYPKLIWLLKEIFSQPLEKQTLIKELDKVEFGFQKRNSWDWVPIIDCINGQFAVKAESGETHTFFKLNQSWFQISGNIIQRIDAEFKKLFRTDHFISTEDEGFLPRPWHPKSNLFTLKDFSQQLNLQTGEAKKLCNTQVSYVSNEGDVLHRKIEGILLRDPIFSSHREKVEKLLKKDKLEKNDLQDELGESYGEHVWRELSKERPVGELKKATTSKTKTEVVEIQMPFFPPKHEMQPHEEQLKSLAFQALHTTDEAPYNEGYLYDVFKGKNEPFQTNESGWIPGDRIEPEGIELFDLIHFPKQKVDARENPPLFLYHVKETFGQKTRDACSQIFNSAILIQEARNGKTKILDQFYAMATSLSEKSDYRKKVKQQVQALGKQGFKDLFLKRKIVFVYAFVDSRKTPFSIQKKPSSIKKESSSSSKSEISTVGEWDDNTSHFSSLIGRISLLHTCAQIEKMGFLFRICQISRPSQIEGDLDELRPSIFDWSSLDDELSKAFEKETTKVFFYRTPWHAEEVWIKQETLGDESCAFHALLGTENDGVFQCDAQEERINFVKELKGQLNPTKIGFNDPNLQKWYEANLKSAIEEADKPDDDENVMRRCAKMLLQKIPTFSAYQKENFYQLQLAKEKELINKTGDQAQYIWSAFDKGGKTKKAFKESLLQDEQKLHSSVQKAMSKLKTFHLDISTKKTRDAYGPQINLVTEINHFEFLKNEKKQEILKDSEVMENFLKCLVDPSYWLCDDELQMLAYIHGTRIEIIRKDVLSEDHDCNNHLDPAKREDDVRPLVVIHGNQNHYSRCLPFPD